MFKKTVAITTMALLAIPAAGHAASNKSDKVSTPICADLPISTDAKDIHVGSQHIHLAGRSNVRACVTEESKLTGTPTVTQYSNCGNTCFAARVADVRAYQDLKVEITYKEDGAPKSISVDPDPIDLARDVEEVCISNHAAGTPDPCVIHLTSPSNLKAKADKREVALKWTGAGEAYGRSVSTTYEVWRSTTGELDSFSMVAQGLTETSLLDTGLTRKTTYWYYVVAVDAEGNRSGGSNPVAATTK